MLLFLPLVGDVLVPEPDAMFTFTCTNDDGSICNKSFESYVQLRAHMVHSRAGSHGERPVHAFAAVTNACPWCKHKFASKLSAAHHIKRALCRGACGGQGSTFYPEIVPTATFDCPVCQQQGILLRINTPLTFVNCKVLC